MRTLRLFLIPAVLFLLAGYGQAGGNLLFSVCFVNNKTGYAVGSIGTIFKTNNGGKKWEKQNSGTTNFLHGVHFPADGRTGYAVGDSGTILTTTNVGRSWFSQGLATTQILLSVQFPQNAETGYAVGKNGTILKTTTGGADWTRQYSDTNITLYSVHFPRDEQTGYTVGDSAGYSCILKTTDGGKAWLRQASGDARSLNSVSFPVDTLIGYTVGNVGTILKTTNGGTTWKAQTAGTLNHLFSVCFPRNAQTGYIAGYNGIIMKTTNGGENWTDQNSGTHWTLFSVTYPQDAQKGIAVGDSGVILRTTDGGARWTNVTGFFFWPIDETTHSYISYDGCIGFRVSLGGSRCLESGLSGSPEGLALARRADITMAVDFSYNIKRLSVHYGGLGIDEWSPILDVKSDLDEGDKVILQGSKYNFGHYGFSFKYHLFNPIGLDVKPVLGYRWCYVKAEMRAKIKSSGEIVEIDNSYKRHGVLSGAEFQVPLLWFGKRGPAGGMKLSFDPFYYYISSINRIHHYGGKIYFEEDRKDSQSHVTHFEVFLEYSQERGNDYRFQHVQLGLGMCLSPRLWPK